MRWAQPRVAIRDRNFEVSRIFGNYGQQLSTCILNVVEAESDLIKRNELYEKDLENFESFPKASK